MNVIEYDDDTTIIPRSTTVLARRLPAARPGKGGAARYVSGRAPVKAIHAKSTPQPGKATDLSAAQTEEERMKAIMGLEAQNWEQEKQQMATYVYSHTPCVMKLTSSIDSKKYSLASQANRKQRMYQKASHRTATSATDADKKACILFLAAFD